VLQPAKHLPTQHTVQTGFICSRGTVVKVPFHFHPVNLGLSSTVTRLSQCWSHRGYLNWNCSRKSSALYFGTSKPWQRGTAPRYRASWANSVW